MKKIVSLILIFLISVSFSLAEEIFSDTFNNADKIAPSSTIRQEDGYITIDSKYYPNAIAVSDESTEYAVINDGKIEIYNMGETNAKLVKTIEDKNIVSSPVGITYANDGRSIWVLNEDNLVKYDLDNENAISKIVGLEEVMSITSSKGYETVSILDSEGKVTGYKELIEGGIAEVPALSFSGVSNPIAISSVGTTDDIIMLNDDEVVYYEFDDNAYEFNSVLNISMGNTACSIAATEDGFVVLNKSGADYYSINEGKSEKKSIYSVSGVNDGVGISLKQDEYEYAIIDEECNVKYYQYDGEKMVENEQLAVQNIKIPRKLILPAYYYSEEITTEEVFNQVTLSVSQETDENSNVTWWVDSGSGYEQVKAGIPTKIEEGNSFIIKAQLNVVDKFGTLPKVENVSLDVSKIDEVKIKKIEVIGITKNIAEQNLPTANFPVKVKRGSEVVIKVETAEDVTDINMRLYTRDGELELKKFDKLETGDYIGSVVFEPDELEGEIIGAEFITDSGYTVDMINFINIESTVSYDLDLQIRQ